MNLTEPAAVATNTRAKIGASVAYARAIVLALVSSDVARGFAGNQDSVPNTLVGVSSRVEETSPRGLRENGSVADKDKVTRGTGSSGSLPLGSFWPTNRLGVFL